MNSIGIRDEMGVCLEPPQFVTGLARVPNGTGEVSRRLTPIRPFPPLAAQGGMLARSDRPMLAGQLVCLEVPQEMTLRRALSSAFA